MTSDAKAAGEFYSEVVGWTTHQTTGGGSSYATFNVATSASPA